MTQVSIIGGGISGLSSACFLASSGLKTVLYEKNDTLGGRARNFAASGFTFDMGPSWYWMPDVFDDFFAKFGKTTADYYELVKLDPGFQIIFGKDDVLKVPSNEDQLYELFEQREKGSAGKLRKFLAEAAFKYRLGMGELIRKPAFSWLEYANVEVLKGMSKAHLFRSVHDYVRSYFSEPGLISLLEFPVLFLGAMPNRIPALYTLMNHAALSQGTYYPLGGMYKLIEAMESLAESLGVEINLSAEVEAITVEKGKARTLSLNGDAIPLDALVASADYHHIEQKLLEKQYRNYSDKYWDSRTMAPSCLIYFLGVSKKIAMLEHHNLFFDTSFEAHSKAIYESPQWPQDPLFYVCCPSKTDPGVAPEGMENLFVLVPLASGLNDSEQSREDYLAPIVNRIEKYCGEDIADHIIFKKSYCVKDFETDYHAFKGNAYGLANTLKQTAVWKPSIRNKRIDNLFYAGQLTVPGPGVPPSLISGEIAASQVQRYLKRKTYESII